MVVVEDEPVKMADQVVVAVGLVVAEDQKHKPDKPEIAAHTVLVMMVVRAAVPVAPETREVVLAAVLEV